jgi:hypothetical protein
MSPLDNELRRTLTQHASDVDATSDLWVQVEHRARVLHRRRVALAGVSGAGVVAAVVVVGLTVAGGSQADRVIVPLNPGPSDSAMVSPSPTVSPTALGGRVPVTEWPRVGANATWVHWDAVLQSMPAQMPSAFTPLREPTIIGSGDTDGGPVAVFVVKAGGHLVAGAVLRSAPDEAVAVHDIATDGDVSYVGVVVPLDGGGGSVDDGVVVGAPTTGQILFKLPGDSDFHTVEGGADPRWAAVTLGHVQAGQPTAQVQVLDGNGDIDNSAYTGPIQVGVTFPDV